MLFDDDKLKLEIHLISFPHSFLLYSYISRSSPSLVANILIMGWLVHQLSEVFSSSGALGE